MLVYLDDILVYSKSEEEHIHHLSTVLKLLSESGYKAKLSKCVFGVPKIPYLGYIVGNGELRADPKKTACVQDWEPPRNVHEVRQFLGLCNHFRKFIHHYSEMVAPLSDLTKTHDQDAPPQHLGKRKSILLNPTCGLMLVRQLLIK